MKLVTVVGTVVKEDERVMLHTSTCDCGEMMVRAKKETSLNHYTQNPKYTAKCCKSQLSYTGEQLFVGNELIDPTVIIEVPVEVAVPVITETIVKAPKTKKERAIKEKVIDSTGLISVGRNGVTNCQMIPAFAENFDKPENLQILFDTYEEVFISAAKYMKDDIKVILQNVISVKYPETIIPMGKKALKKIAVIA